MRSIIGKRIGALCLTHGEKNKAEVDKYGRKAFEENISDAVSLLK